MNKEDLDAIAERQPYCRNFGESVSLSRAERDELVALARDGMRYRWLRDTPWPEDLQPIITLQQNARWDSAVDAEMAKEGA